MKQFFAFIKKEFYHILRDTRTIMILLIMPVIQIILFGFAISTEVKNIRTLILAPNYDIAVQQIVDRLEANEYFQIIQIVHSPEEIQQAFRKGNADLAIVFPQQYSNRIITRNNTYKLLQTHPNRIQLSYGVIMHKAFWHKPKPS